MAGGKLGQAGAAPLATVAAVSDPVRERRRRLARLADLGQRVGYGLFGVAVAAFVVGAVTEFRGAVVAVVVACMAAGSVVLAPAIVLGYAARAAEREDREQGR
jgi:hypothetical protein